MYKKLKSIPLTLEDVKEVEPETYKSLKQLIQMKENGENLLDVGLFFSIIIEFFGAPKEIQLVPKGSSKPVNNDNLDDYLLKYVQYLLVDSIEIQFAAFKNGFQKLMKDNYFNMFTPFEFDIFVSGEEVYDWEALKSTTQYADGYSDISQTVLDFWDFFDEMNHEQRKEFLRFSTGSSRAPVGGLANIKLIIQKNM